MSMKVLIISTSLRTNSNSDILARKCVRGALDAGHEAEYVSLKEKDTFNKLGYKAKINTHTTSYIN